MLGVVSLHTQRSLTTGFCYNPWLYYLCRFSMPVFFMINGYLILSHVTFDLKYFKKKTLNILRLVLIWSIITSIYYLLVYGHKSIKEIIYDFCKSFASRGVIPFWFFISFVIIYTLVLIIGINRVKSHLQLIVIVSGLLCVLFDIASLISIVNGGYFVQKYIPQSFRIWTWVFYFSLGYWINQMTHKIKFLHLIVVSVVALIYQYFLCYMILGKINSEYCYDNIIIILWSCSLFVFFKNLNYSSIIGKAIVFVSKNSFGVFLLHPFLIDAFDLTNKIDSWSSGLLIWLIVFVACFCFSVLLSRIPIIKSAFSY